MSTENTLRSGIGFRNYGWKVKNLRDVIISNKNVLSLNLSVITSATDLRKQRAIAHAV